MKRPARQALDKARRRAKKLAGFIASVKPAGDDVVAAGPWAVAMHAAKDVAAFIETLAGRPA